MPEQTTLVSHGWVKRCRVCEQHGHAKWHEVARGDINPVALIQMVESLNDDGTAVISCVVDWVCLMAGIDKPAMRAMLESERDSRRTVAAVDPQGDSNTGKPTTRVKKSS